MVPELSDPAQGGILGSALGWILVGPFQQRIFCDSIRWECGKCRDLAQEGVCARGNRVNKVGKGEGVPFPG